MFCAHAIEDVTEKNYASSDESSGSLSLWHVVPFLEVLPVARQRRRLRATFLKRITRAYSLLYRTFLPVKFYRNQPSRFASSSSGRKLWTELLRIRVFC